MFVFDVRDVVSELLDVMLVLTAVVIPVSGSAAGTLTLGMVAHISLHKLGRKQTICKHSRPRQQNAQREPNTAVIRVTLLRFGCQSQRGITINDCRYTMVILALWSLFPRRVNTLLELKKNGPRDEVTQVPFQKW